MLKYGNGYNSKLSYTYTNENTFQAGTNDQTWLRCGQIKNTSSIETLKSKLTFLNLFYLQSKNYASSSGTYKCKKIETATWLAKMETKVFFDEKKD